jgi:hypothetical protein
MNLDFDYQYIMLLKRGKVSTHSILAPPRLSLGTTLYFGGSRFRKKKIKPLLSDTI